ncbi:hypothetical protein BH24ACT3_BH24ACT3_10520 [soil metagenome]
MTSAPAGELATPAALAGVERWFVRRGTPQFIDHYSARDDAFTRAVPALTLIFLVEMLGAINPEWSVPVNLAAAGGGLLLLLAAGAGLNRLRGRPPFQRPDRVGTVELAVFVAVPAAVPLVFGGQGYSALGVALLNLAILGVIYLVTSYALVALTRWAAVETVRELGQVFGLLTRALPLLLLFVTFLFINAEVWQVADALDGVSMAVVVGLFFVIGTGFLLTRLPTEIGQLATFDRPADVTAAVGDSPVAGLVGDLTDDELVVPALSRRQRGNVILVVLFSEGLQVVLVSVVIGAFFVLFGLVAVPGPVIESWAGPAAVADPLVRFDVAGRSVVVTAALLRVAGFLAAFSGLYFTVYVITDATYRQEFFDQVVGEVRETLAVRVVYLALLRRAQGAGPGDGG